MFRLALTLVCAATLPGQEIPADESVALADYESCGVNSLYTINRLLGCDTSLAEVRSLLGPPANDGSHSLEDLRRAGAKMGFNPMCVQYSPDRPDLLPAPCIVQITRRDGISAPSHFLVVLNADQKQVHLFDPPAPHFAISPQRFQNYWNGYALVFVSNDVASVELATSDHQSTFVRDMSVAWTLATASIAMLILVVLLWGIVARRSDQMGEKPRVKTMSRPRLAGTSVRLVGAGSVLVFACLDNPSARV